MRRELALGWATIIFTLRPALADKVDDFKNAVSKTGCESIPYSDLQSSCKSQQSDMKDWCEGGRGPSKCEPGVTADIRNRQEKEGRNRDSLNERRKDLEDRKSRAVDDSEKARIVSELDSVAKDLEASAKRIEDLKSELVRRGELVDKTTYTINKCIDYRTAVMNVFAYSLDKVRGESSADLKPYVDPLVSKYQSSKEGHQEQIKTRENALEVCRKERPSN